MTLDQFLALYPRTKMQLYGTSGATQLFLDGIDANGMWHLWHLSDHHASSTASGPSVILVKKNA